MACDFLVLQFETKKQQYIVGVSASAEGLSYATFGMDRKILHMVPSDYAKEMWVGSVIDFLERRITFHMPDEQNDEDQPMELSTSIDMDADGIPDAIIGNFNIEFVNFFKFLFVKHCLNFLELISFHFLT